MDFDELKKLKKEKDAVILAHYYVNSDIQKIADYVGDSFYLAKVAQKLDNKVIILAGVYFMAESVKILNPDKHVLMIDEKADCPMAHMISVEKIEEMRKKYDDLAVVTYINSTAEIKAHSDICVTSSNAVNVVNKLKEKNIFFVPDKNLGSHVASQIKDKNFILNDGFCPVHNKIELKDIEDLREKYVDAKILTHPECRKEMLDISDYIGSTKGIIEEVGKLDNCDKFIILTEKGISTELYNLYPENTFYFIGDFICQDMKMPTMEKLLNVIKNMENEIFVDEYIAEKAITPLKRMLELG